jgi:hypothetical protein
MIHHQERDRRPDFEIRTQGGEHSSVRTRLPLSR